MTRLPALRSLPAIGMLLLLTAWSTLPAQQGAPADDDDAPPEGIEVLARGPVHEAYAEPAQSKITASAVVAKEPPEAIEEEPPDQKPDGEGVQWLPGYWAWDEERDNFLWISGFWRMPPPNRRWLPGHWTKIETGWQWVPGFWAPEQPPAQVGQPQPQAQQITYLPPPPEPMEVGPSVPAPDADHYYVAGYWMYRDTRYVWRPGFWARCRPNWVWVPAHYVWSPCGYVFVDGYWDYTLRERGLLFAPVAVNLTVVRRPGWCYRPRYVIQDDCLTAALFVRPGCSTYYFGDYFEVSHRRAGYVAWNEVRVGHYHCDPLFSYYRVSYRSTPGWEVSLRASYVGRYNGEIARPPRTLVQQNTVVNNITVNNITNNTTIVNNVGNKTVNVNNGTMLTSLKQVEKKGGVALKPVTAEARVSEAVAAKEVVKAAAERGRVEKEVLVKGPPPMKATDAPRTVKVEMPKSSPAARIESATPSKAPGVLPKLEGKNEGKLPVVAPKPELKAPVVMPKVEGKAPAVPAKLEGKTPIVAPKVDAGKPVPMPPIKPELKNTNPTPPVTKPAPLPPAVNKPAPLPPTVNKAVPLPEKNEAKPVAPPPAAKVVPPPPANNPVVPPPAARTAPTPQTIAKPMPQAPKVETRPPPPKTAPPAKAADKKDKDKDKEKEKNRR